MEPSILKDVCAEVTCLHTSGLRKVAVIAIGQTVAVGGGVSVRSTKQGRVSESCVLRKPVGYLEEVIPSDVSVVSDQVNSFKGNLICILQSMNCDVRASQNRSQVMLW